MIWIMVAFSKLALEQGGSCWSADSSLLCALNRLPHMDELIKARSAIMSQRAWELYIPGRVEVLAYISRNTACVLLS